MAVIRNPSRLAGERGAALVTSLSLVLVMLTVSFAALAFVDTQQRESARERQREATFVLTEGVLNTQIFLLSRQWPGTPTAAYPRTCTKANATDFRCPDDPRLAASFRGADYRAGITWVTEIRDNPVPTSENFYDETKMADASIPSWDANKDAYLWVRAQAVLANGHERTLVALVKAEELATNFPKHAVIAGSISMSQSGNHTYLYTRDDQTGENGRVVVRCSPPDAAGCAQEGKPQQISPAQVESVAEQKAAMSPESIQQLRLAAIANGTYYGPGQCPTSLQGPNPGDIVFIEVATGCNAHNNNTSVYNSKENPGVLVIGSGHFELAGPTYYGLLYHTNASWVQPGDTAVPVPVGTPAVTLKNNSVLSGALIIDGSGQLAIGNNNGTKGFKGNIVFDSNARNALKVFGTAGIVQNSFRELNSKR